MSVYPSAFMPDCPCVLRCICPCVCIHLPVCLSGYISLSVYLCLAGCCLPAFCMGLSLSEHLFVCVLLSVYISDFMLVCQFACPSARLSARRCLFLTVCLSVSCCPSVRLSWMQ